MMITKRFVDLSTCADNCTTCCYFQATSLLVNAIRGQAESHPDSDVQKRLLAAAKALADATAKMVEAAKVLHFYLYCYALACKTRCGVHVHV